MDTVFVTGFPGFLGSALLPRLLAAVPDITAVCLVQSRYLAHARRRVGTLDEARPGSGRRIRLVTGDITRPALGLADPDVLAADVRAIYHLAALYDVTATRPRMERINVDGTRNVLDFAASCPALQRLHHVSTCYVSGRRRGVFRESDLEEHGPFNNVYEETKHRAEVAVRERMAAGLPATIYRPAIVVGDRDTGRTQKYDGPYFVIRVLLRQPTVAVLPVVGDPARVRVNVVPRDFVADAITHLSRLDGTEGRTYHLADPDPLTVDAMLREVAGALGKRVLRVPLPHRLARWSMETIPGLERWVGIPAEALDYFIHPTRYDVAAARAALENTSVRVPRFSEYVDRLVAFVREHPDVSPDAMA